jgi:hypothetical protein
MTDLHEALEEAIRDAYQAGQYAAAVDEGKVWKRRPTDPDPDLAETEQQVVERLLGHKVMMAHRVIASLDEDPACGNLDSHTIVTADPAKVTCPQCRSIRTPQVLGAKR